MTKRNQPKPPLANEVVVCKTNRGCAYTIRIIVENCKFSMGTGNYGLTYEQACEKGRWIANRCNLDFNPCEKENE